MRADATTVKDRVGGPEKVRECCDDDERSSREMRRVVAN